jgi:hypothetical protein
MAQRDAALTTVKGGINRLRTKGAALEDSLYDLLNGYVTAQKTVVVRPGTVREAQPTGTKGLMAYNGQLNVFAIEEVEVPEGFALNIITHPTDATVDIETIDFAKPYCGFPYVVATFTDGVTQHYWLQSGAEWQADTMYRAGDIVVPSTPTGLAYQATRASAQNPSWAPNVRRSVGEVIEPTEYNDYYYTVVDVQGTNPRSGETEPEWPEEDGAQVFEDADSAAETSNSQTSAPDNDTTPNPETQDRYNPDLLP